MRGKPIADWTMDELKDILERVRQALGERDYTVMNAVVETLDYLTHLAKDKQAAEIYRILVGSRSEKPAMCCECWIWSVKPKKRRPQRNNRNIALQRPSRMWTQPTRGS